MKIRNGFVSNSSSSSFIATLAISNDNKTDVGFNYNRFCIPVKDLLELDSWDLDDKYGYSVPDELVILKNDNKDDFSVLYRTSYGDLQINNVIEKALKEDPNTDLEKCFLIFESEQDWNEGSDDGEDIEFPEFEKRFNKKSIIHKSTVNWSGYDG